jgi:hypothetical protein
MGTGSKDAVCVSVLESCTALTDKVGMSHTALTHKVGFAPLAVPGRRIEKVYNLNALSGHTDRL